MLRAGKLVAGFVVVALAVAGCAGDDDDDDDAAGADAGTEVSAETDADGSGDDEAGDDDGDAAGDDTATGEGGSTTFATSDGEASFLGNVESCESSGPESLALESSGNGYELTTVITDGEGGVDVRGAADFAGVVETISVTEGEDGRFVFQIFGTASGDEDVTFDLTGDCQ